MNKCNNCAKFLTCDRRECKQITFLQAEQLDRIKIKPQYFKIDVSVSFNWYLSIKYLKSIYITS